MNLDSAVEFAPDFEWGRDNDIKKMVEEFKLKSQEMGFYDQRMTYNNYHDNIEDELKAAYEETTKLESDMRRLVTLTEVLLEQVEHYENKITDMRYEKDNAHAESNYMQENIEAMLEKEREKEDKICQLEHDISEKEKQLNKSNSAIQSLNNKIQDLEDQLCTKEDEIAKLHDTLTDKESEFDDKIRQLQDLIEYKDDHISEITDSLSKVDERMESLERERDNLERSKEKLTIDLSETMKNMNHYRSSCQSLSRELQEANDANYDLQMRYDSLLKDNNEKIVKRMGSGLSIDSIDGEFDEGENAEVQVQSQTNNVQNDNEAETLENELDGFNDLEGFDANDDTEDIYNEQEINNEEQNITDNDQNELEDFDNNNINDEDENIDSEPSNVKIMVESEIQTEEIQLIDFKVQTDKVIQKLIEIDIQTDSLHVQQYSVNTQTDEIRKHLCSVKMQTDNIKMKDKSIDTSFIEVEKKNSKVQENAENLSNDDKNQKSIKEDVKPNKTSKPALFLDNLSSPSDGGSQKHAEGNHNVLTDRATTKSTSSGYNKKDLNYMLNRDPLKEFFHLTLQSIRMNSPHMNQILNIDCDKFYKKAVDDSVPFNHWGKWLEDQLNRIILSKILQMSLQSKIERNKLPSIKITKAIENIEKMNKEDVIKMINKKAPATSRHTESKKGGMFQFGFMKKDKDKPKVEKKKHTSEFDEILEKPAVVPKTSRNVTAKHFIFDENKNQK